MRRRKFSARTRAGIYPLVVKLVLVAVILVVSLAIASYVLSLVTSTREYFELKPLLYVTHVGIEPAPILSIYAINDGARAEVLLKVEIVTGTGSYTCNAETSIESGFRGHVILAPKSYQGPIRRGANDKVVGCDWKTLGSPQIVEGSFYTVRLYTAQHGVMSLNVLCQRAPG